MSLNPTAAALEAVLFAAGEPLEIERLAEALGTSAWEIRSAADALSAFYDEAGSALMLCALGESLQIATRPAFAENIRAALEVKRNAPLSNAAMETLTIIAYNQPVTKGFVERVRGVDSGSVVNTLVERGLLEEAGRIEVPGRPVTYRTTAQFLRCFGLSSLSELPPLPTGEQPDLFAAGTEGEVSEFADEEPVPEQENIETVENEDTDVHEGTPEEEQ